MELTPKQLASLSAPRKFLRVYMMPDPPFLIDGYAFGGGKTIPFLNVDWFEALADMSRDEIVDFIKGKRYYIPTRRYLVLGNTTDDVFTIDPVKE